ncbi:MAG: DUF4399 domain-containing protein [Burkholderiales bacterium]
MLHQWVVPPPHGVPDAYFTNLQDGAKVEAPFVLKFGLTQRGLVPAKHWAGRAGHHHLLVDQALPIDLKKPLPFNENYVHFGKGQMESVVDLPPGEHTVRLLLADGDHVVYFIYSKELKFTVTKRNADVDKKALVGPPRVELLSPANKAVVSKMPMRVQFHASGLNVASVGGKAAETGHFRLTLERTGQKPELLDFVGGQTEVWLDLPKGEYSARLDMASNASPGKSLTRVEPASFTVP